MDVLKRTGNPLFVFAVGLILSGIAIYIQIPYVVILFITIVGLMFVYENPFLGSIFTLLAYPVLPDELSLVLLLGLFAIYCIYKMTRKAIPFRIYAHEVPYYIYFILMIIATVTSSMFIGSIRDLAIHTAGLGFSLIILDQLTDHKRFNQMIVALVCITTILALYGIFQYIFGVEIKREWVDTSSNTNIKARVYSVFGNPNIFAEFLVMMIPLSVGLFWSTKRDGVKLFYIGVFCVQLVALFMTMSRGGWVGLAFSAIIFLYYVRKRLLLLAVPAGAGALLLLPKPFLNRLLTIFNFADSSTSYRFKIWEITGEVIRDHFLVGVGLGHKPFKYIFETYIRTMPIFHAHNTFIEIFAELGIVGFVLFILFIAFVWANAYNFLIKSKNRYRQIMGSALLASFGGLLIHGMFENILYLTKISTSFWVILALIYGLIRIEKQERKREYLEKNLKKSIDDTLELERKVNG